MNTIIVTDSALRELVREVLENNNSALSGPKLSDDAVNVSAVIDPQASDSDPTNEMTPQNKAELQNMIRTVIRDLPDEKLSGVFKAVQTATSDDKEAKKSSSAGTTVEAAVRLKIRAMLAEAGLDPADIQADEEEQRIAADIEKRQRRGKYKPSSTDYDADVPFNDVAKEMGMAVSGAKQAVDKALLKVQFTASMDDDDLAIMTLQAMQDYIELLQSSEELSQEDVQFLRANPETVAELDGFRIFLHDYIARTREEQGIDWMTDDLDAREKVSRKASKRVIRGDDEEV